MRKFFRMLFSRLTLMILAILLQIAVAVAIANYSSSNYKIVSIVSNMIVVIVFLGIINRDMSSDTKLPWCILVAVFPIVGIVLYLTFSRNFVPQKDIRAFKQLPQTKLAEDKPVVPQKYAGQIEYLKNMGAPAFSQTDTQYFASGELFLVDFLTELDKAEKFVFMEYFIVEHGKMFDSILEVLKRKIAQGVEVRLLYDDFGSWSHTNRSFCSEMRKLGIKCERFAKIRPVASAIYNNRDHRKITVIDGKVGYMSGFNLADEYINHTHPFGYWKDSGVKLIGNAVSSLTTMFLQMFDMTTRKTENFEQYLLSCEKNGISDKGIVVPFGDGPRPIYKEQIARSVYLNLINQAETSLLVTTPYLITDDAVTDALRRAAQRGVNVCVVIPKIPDKKTVYAMTKQSCKKLVKSGVSVYTFTAGFIHAKSIVADGVAGVIGTINLDYRSLVHHYECGTYMYKTLAVRQLHDDLTAMISRCELQLNPPKLRLWEKIVCAFANIFRPML